MAFRLNGYWFIICSNQRMKKQQYANHKRYYIPHHFILLPALMALFFIGAFNSYRSKENNLSWLLFTISIACIFYLAIMLRQHYALGNQNRIVRLEFKLRYFEMFGKRSEAVEKQLSFDQIAALRFANDEEFTELLHKALQEGLSGDAIKRAILDWQADNERV